MRILPPFICLAIAVLGLGASVAAATPPNSATVAAVFPPWWSPPRAFIAASGVGSVVRVGAYANVLVVQSRLPGLGPRLQRSGALVVLNPQGLGLCGQKS